MKFDDSRFKDGWVGLYEMDENLIFEETRSFRTIAHAEKFIAELKKAINKYKITNSQNKEVDRR
ncbi:hypothetical protein GF312_22260 [Candidatus Poribacteria bacterium]|nr:hypothetical protein [Candidatus Poribacteria bacterium]